MNTETFYKTVGGDFQEVMRRFITEERILRFVRKFPMDGSFSALKDGLQKGSVEEVFRAAHTLKGVAQNLGFTALSEKASAVTEVLRAGSLAVAELMPDLENLYRLTVENIALLD